jgi:cell division protein FtsI (penicillin-binding protein 3)
MVERRILCLAGLFLLWGGWILQNLVSLQVIHHRKWAGRAQTNQQTHEVFPAPRGTIFDRDGRPLAMSIASHSVSVDPSKVNAGITADLLGYLLHLDRADLYQKITQAAAAGRRNLIVKRNVTAHEYENILNLKSRNVEWVNLVHESARHYPNGQLAAHVVGSVDFQEKGNAGIEQAFDSDLRGTPGETLLLTDVHRRGIAPQKSVPAKPGASLTLSIDERLQFVAEREIALAVAAHGAASGSVVVMNPNTGDVLAMASYPAFDPNQPVAGQREMAARSNHAISVPFEPGSVYKVVTLSAALETTNLRPESPINCNGGKITLFTRTIHDSHAGLGVIPMATVLAKSSNVGAIQIGLKVGQTNMYDYMRRFGFGRKTGVPLPGESSGIVRKLERWGKTSLASMSMGQEVSVTTLQLAQAASVVANGGMLVKPRLILKIDGRPQPIAPRVRVLKPENAITMRQMMEGVVLHGTGSHARLTGYSSGGKTGSAQIYDYATKRYTHTYNGSYMGFAPMANPSVVVVVTLNGTRGESGFGGATAAPVFRVVAAEALRVFDVPKDLPDTIPEVQIARNAEDLNDLAIADLEGSGHSILEETDEDGNIPAAPHPLAAIPAVPAIETPPPTLEIAPPTGPRVPNFSGKTMRAVLAEAAAQGLTVKPAGSGVARVQSPPPGAPLHPGEPIRVQFVR